MAVIDEVSLSRNSKVGNRDVELFRGEQLREFIVFPAVKLAFMAFAVSVLRRVEASLGMCHVSQDITKYPARDLSVAGLAAHQVSVQVELGELSVVVKHLLEVRHEPLCIDRIAGKAAAELIMNPTRRHPVARGEDHLDRLGVPKSSGIAQQKLWLAGLRKFRRPTKPAMYLSLIHISEPTRLLSI